MADNDPVMELAKRKIELEPDEKSFEMIQKHWGSSVWPLVGLGLLIIISVVTFFISLIFGGIDSTFFIGYLIILGFIYLILILFGLSELYSYYQSVFIITNQRLIDCNQVNFLSRRVQTIDLHEIQSCSGSVGAGIGAILNFGTLSINTIGDKAIHVEDIPSPETVSAQVMHYHYLVAHGGVPEAHNVHATKPDEDKTPILENIPKVAEKVAEGLPISLPGETETEKAKEKGREPSLPQPVPNKPPSKPSQQAANQTDNQTGVEGLAKAVRITFRLPSERCEEVMSQLTVDQEPVKHYLADTDYYEVEITATPEKTDEFLAVLQQSGAEQITKNEVETLDPKVNPASSLPTSTSIAS